MSTFDLTYDPDDTRRHLDDLLIRRLRHTAEDALRALERLAEEGGARRLTYVLTVADGDEETFDEARDALERIIVKLR